MPSLNTIRTLPRVILLALAVQVFAPAFVLAETPQPIGPCDDSPAGDARLCPKPAASNLICEPIDPQASKETKTLFQQLLGVKGEKILFGHQHTTLYGVGWKATDASRSDVKTACGRFPAVYGWDMLRLDRNLEPMRQAILAAHQRGGINTTTWHMWNPVTGKNFYDITPAVGACLPGGSKHDAFKSELDKFAKFILTLRDEEGKIVPIIFRPFHEHTGSWFWWGKGNCSAEEYAKLWRFTVEYLRDTKGLHNLLYAYSPAKNPGGTRKHYLWGYPGDKYVDILGYDHYCQDMREAIPGLRVVVQMAQERGKVPAFTETGVPKGLSNAEPGNYFTERVLRPLKEDPLARQIAYLLVWGNRDKQQFWIPYEGHELMSNFRKFADDPFIAFGEDL